MSHTRAGPPSPRSEPEPETEEQRKARAQREEAETRAKAEELTRDLPRQGDASRPPLTPAEAAQPDEEMVTMTFPQPVLLTIAGFRQVQFQAGLQEVPQSLADHPYLARSGAQRTKLTSWQARLQAG